MKVLEKIIKIIFMCLIISLTILLNNHETLSASKDLSIKLKAKSLVIGPFITLGDVGYLFITDNNTKTRLSSIRIGIAPPPGESTEITLNHIKRKLESEGFGEYAAKINGPKTIRVSTAQKEIDKIFLNEELANNVNIKESLNSYFNKKV